MKRLLAAALALAVASAAAADIPPPPPPKGMKYVSVTNEVVIGKDVSGYVFVVKVASGPGAPRLTYTKANLTPGKAAPVPNPGRRGFVVLLAVPADAAAGYKTDAELAEALKANKVKAAAEIAFPSTATVSDAVKANPVKWTTTVTAIDPNTGAETKVEGEGYVKPPALKPAEGARPPKPLAQNGPVVAGVAATLAVLIGGLWAAGRARRKV